MPNVARANLVALAAAAALTLVAGLLFRSSLEERSAPAAAAPPSEAAALRQLSQESQLRRLAGYLSDRAAELAPLVEYRPELGASSVRLRDSTYLSTTPATPVLLTRGTAGQGSGAPLAAPGDSTDHGWVLVVGRRADGEVLSLSGLAGGRLPATCGGRETREIALGVPLNDALAGAGVFSLDGRLLGTVARCPERMLALAIGAATRLLDDSSAATAARLERAYGVTLAPLDSLTRAFVGVDSGLLVTAARRGAPAARAGVRAGDVLLAVDSAATPGAVSLDLVGAGVWRLRRGADTVAVRVAPGDTARGAADSADALGARGLTLDPRGPGALVRAVRAGSAAADAGLRPGDRLLRVGAADVRTPADARRLLAAPTATLLVVLRDSVERAVTLPR